MSGQQQLAGISTGGWIAIAAIVGIVIGVAGTLLLQCYRRCRLTKYLDKEPPEPHYRPAKLPQAPANQYFSPLTAKGLPASPSAMLHHQHHALRNSMRLSDAGDTGGWGSQDQHSQLQRHQVLQVSNNNEYISQASSKLPEQRQHVSLPTVLSDQQMAAKAAGRQDPYQPPSAGHQQALPINQRLQEPRFAPSPDSTEAPHTQYELPSNIIADILARQASNASSRALDSHPVQHANLLSRLAVQPHMSLPKRPASATTAASPGHSRMQKSGLQDEDSGLQGNQSVAELEDEYEIEDLDSDWLALLSDIDARLGARGADAMNARERSVAIKQLLVAAGSKGVDFAMDSTLQEVLRFRQLHGH
eukprot:GHRR01023098.1.p1 GENE.GHRR01023098.1~~GHRR01023098.1.p1  ORF type:complete len:361 (+),score=136.50 GHRR01023098.1:354-1436(+)